MAGNKFPECNDGIAKQNGEDPRNEKEFAPSGELINSTGGRKRNTGDNQVHKNGCL